MKCYVCLINTQHKLLGDRVFPLRFILWSFIQHVYKHCIAIAHLQTVHDNIVSFPKYLSLFSISLV